MKQVKIFLLDFYPSGKLGNALRKILESEKDQDIKLQHESIEVCGPVLCDSETSNIILTFNPDVIFLVISPYHIKKIEALFQSLSKDILAIPIIAVIEEGKSDEMISLLKLGIDDFVTPPLKVVDILPRTWRLLEQRRTEETLTYKLKEKLGIKQLIGNSSSFVAVIKKIPLVAKSDASVLISGETGTGKELCARAIHYLSPRADKPFVPVNCGAIPLELIENELFGHIKGAFTGASTSKKGLMQEANGGTLFLDEIDCLPLTSQVKLLRFLQEKEYRQLGSTKILKADVRVITATNIDLEDAVREGKFRKDLYYRLNIIPFSLPPLRDRQEDIPLLAEHFLARYTSEYNKHIKGINPDAMQKLMLYEWPGNVRELEYVIERTIVLSENNLIQSDEIIIQNKKSDISQKSFKEAKAKVIAQFERSYIQGLLYTHQGNITRAAQIAKKNRRAFWQLICKHKIDVQSFKHGQNLT